MSRIKGKRSMAAAKKSALTVVQTEGASGAVLSRSMDISSSAAEPARSFRGLSVGSQEWEKKVQDALRGLGSILNQTAGNALRLLGQIKVRRAKKRLAVQETVSLGEKRFVAIVQVDGQQFLLGGAPNSVSMLAQLSGDQVVPEQSLPSFSQALKSQCEADRNLA